MFPADSKGTVLAALLRLAWRLTTKGHSVCYEMKTPTSYHEGEFNGLGARPVLTGSYVQLPGPCPLEDK